MASVEVIADLTALAQAGAELVVKQLREAIQRQKLAIWVLAGGTAPMGAYKILAEHYADKLDWSKVTVLLGDERCVPADHPDSNWFQISQVLLDKVPVKKIRPDYELSAEEAAKRYEALIKDLPQFDVVWLGMGEDGHTLSLFPSHPGLQNTDPLVIAVHDSPKPPPDRISLTLKALQRTKHCTIMAAGAAKATIVAQALGGDPSLPIVQAVQTIEQAGGDVIWLLDQAAANSSQPAP